MATQTPGPERTIGQLVADATHDVQHIFRGEVALAKAEVTKGVKVMGKGAGFLAAAAFVGLLGLIFLFHTLSLVLAIWLPIWAAYLITTVFMFLVAGVLALMGQKAIKRAKPIPERAIASTKETLEMLKP